jgi:hypothetical protein
MSVAAGSSDKNENGGLDFSVPPSLLLPVEVRGIEPLASRVRF